MSSARSQDSQRVACGVLAIVFPYLAIHRFLLGDVTGGVVRILLNLALGAGSVISFIEGVLYLTKSDEQFVEVYQVGRKAWF